MTHPDFLRINDLKVQFNTGSVVARVLDGVHLTMHEREVLALVGGSGSGKTMTGLSILRLLPEEAQSEGKISWLGQDIHSLSENQMRAIRGSEISMVFQEPLSSLNPVFTIGYQLEEVLRLHTQYRGRALKDRCLDLLKTVGISEPQKTINDYPHQLSGGLRQRAMIAMSIAGNPKLIIADEPTSNLDVTIQAQILELFAKLKEELGVSILLITHDLSIVRHLADRVAVMFQGKVVECNTAEQVMESPCHFYTKQLLEAVRT
ncbi:ABC transporter ATP-binding protein [Candidatus Omnitrophota bacterium]